MKNIRLLLVTAIVLLGTWATAQTDRTCIRVVDGDTIVLDGEETVRLIGVDTPETKDPRKPVQYFAEEAYQFTKRLVEGKQVKLMFDQQRKDKYGRTLAYVFLPDGTCINSTIIRQGYGFAYLKYPFMFLEEYFQIEREARVAAKGMWGSPIAPAPSQDSPPNTTILGLAALSPSNPIASSNAKVTVYVTGSGTKYHSETCRFAKYSSAKATDLETAISNGYGPCSICKPPTLQTATAITETSSVTSSVKSPSSSSSGSSDRTVMTGPRGGKYYINSKGKKVYIKKK
jgi:micrococcal nuclease